MARSIRNILDQGDLNKLGAAAQQQALGSTLNLTPASAVLTAVAGVALLPDDAAAAQVLMAWDRTNGVYLTVAAPETVAGAGQVSVSPTGDLRVDPACLSVEVLYLAMEGTLVTETLQVAASAATFLSSKVSRRILSASVVTGIIPGAKVVAARGSAPAATGVALTDDGAGIVFNAADVVAGSCTVTYLASPTVFANARLNDATRGY